MLFNVLGTNIAQEYYVKIKYNLITMFAEQYVTLSFIHNTQIEYRVKRFENGSSPERHCVIAF